MPILNHTDLKSFRGRLVIIATYVLLTVGGVTMVFPFMVTLTGSVSTYFDYERRSPIPRFLWSREDRFMRTLCSYFPPSHRASIRQMRCYFPDVPESWQLWAQVGDDTRASDAWARKQLDKLKDPNSRRHLEAAARDYGDFMANWDLRETILAYDQRYVAPFLRQRYRTLARFNAAWEVSIEDFTTASVAEWGGEAIDQPNYVPITDVRYADLLVFRQAYRENRFTPFLAAKDAPAGYLRPAALRFLWEDYYVENRPESVIPKGKSQNPNPKIPIQNPGSHLENQTPHTANRVSSLPFPVPSSSPVELRRIWYRFLKNAFPMRHIEIRVSGSTRAAFRAFLIERFRNLDYLDRLLERKARSWDDIELTPTVPSNAAQAKVWMDFVRNAIPVEEWVVRDTLPEQAFQEFALKKWGNLQAINSAYGLKLASLQQLRVPFGEAVLVTFANHELGFLLDQLTGSYRAVFDFLFHRGRAVQNTVLLVALTLLVTLTVNPLAGYALSRFKLRGTERIIVFCLATMAFPAAVAAIPGFLLLRDFGLLNTFAALVLPGAANGMTIFLLKGFFDALPKELYEAATIDGAPEWTIFRLISIPLVKPILAVSMLNAFIAAYNGWEWAIIVCQDKKMWTIAVWTYQFYQNLSGQPFTVMAAFVMNSIPVLLVFLFCQKIILRGIILPQMK